MASVAPKTETTDVERLKRMFSESQDLTQEARSESQTDIDYYDSKQWSDDEKRALADRKQPPIVINRIKPLVNGIIGVIQRGKSEPRAFPRTPTDEDSSDVVTDALRFIADFNRLDQLKLRCFKDMLVPGSMAAQVLVNSNLQVTIDQIRFEEFFYDPRSRREDFRDARYLGIARWMYADDVSALYPDQREAIDATVDSGTMSAISDTFQDRPNGRSQPWVDRKGRRMLVVEIYIKEGGSWMRGCFHAGGVLAYGPSPYLDDQGKPTCPIEACSAYVDRDNNRYGPVRDMRGPQDEINQRRSKSLHFASTRQVQEMQLGSGMGSADEARKEAARPDGVIPSGWQIIPQHDGMRQQFELMQEAKAEIDRQGPNPAILGREGADSSGRALLARQQSGLVELAVLFGHLEDWELRIYRQCWARARQYWTGPQWVRVTDDGDAPRFIGLNQPPTMQGPDGKDIPGQFTGMVDPQTGQPAADGEVGKPAFRMPDGQMVLGYKNAVAELDVDIILDSTPDTANIQQEQFQDLMQLVGSNPAYAQTVPFEMLLELSAVPHKRQLIDKLKTFREQSAQAAQAQQQAAQQAQAAQIDKVHSEAELNAARTAKTQLEASAAAHAMMTPPIPPAAEVNGRSAVVGA
jgi:hypothetical protein